MARTLAVGLALAVGATLLTPATAAVAVPVAACPAATLTETQLNHLIVDLKAATIAKTATGYRVTYVRYDGDEVFETEVLTRDVAHGRYDSAVDVSGKGHIHHRSLANGYQYDFQSTAEPWFRPVLAVLGRTSVWINAGEREDAPDPHRLIELPFMRHGGACADGESGVTVSFDDDGYVTTLTTDASLAVTSSTATVDGEISYTTTIGYGQFDVPDIPAAQRITSVTWGRAYDAAGQREALTSYAKKVAARAKAAAERAKRPVRATDVKAVKATLPPGTKRSLVKTGIMVTATDPYTRKTLRITVTVAQQTLRIGDNW